MATLYLIPHTLYINTCRIDNAMKKLLFLILLSLPIALFCQTLASFRNIVPNGYNFWIYTPGDYDSTRAEKPLILFLHGASLSGSDLSRVRKYGPLTAISYGHDIDAVILAPQSPGGSWKPDNVENILNWTLAHYAVDTNRIYVIGMSMGGYGTINYTGTYPDRVAAAMALCGGGNLKGYCNLNKFPLWIMHGTADRAVGVGESQKVVNAMKACGDTPLLRFTKLPGQSHAALAKIFYLEETYEWLFAHRLNDSVRNVNTDIDITPKTMEKAYQNIDRNKIKVTVVNGQTGTVEPAATSSSGDASDVTYHRVKKGETLSSIARKYHTTVSKLCKLNHIKETSILQIGQKLKVR